MLVYTLGDKYLPNVGAQRETVLTPPVRIWAYVGSLNNIGSYLVTVFLILLNSTLYGVENTGMLTFKKGLFLLALLLGSLSVSNLLCEVLSAMLNAL